MGSFLFVSVSLNCHDINVPNLLKRQSQLKKFILK